MQDVRTRWAVGFFPGPMGGGLCSMATKTVWGCTDCPLDPGGQTLGSCNSTCLVDQTVYRTSLSLQISVMGCQYIRIRTIMSHIGILGALMIRPKKRNKQGCSVQGWWEYMLYEWGDMGFSQACIRQPYGMAMKMFEVAPNDLPVSVL